MSEVGFMGNVQGEKFPDSPQLLTEPVSVPPGAELLPRSAPPPRGFVGLWSPNLPSPDVLKVKPSSGSPSFLGCSLSTDLGESVRMTCRSGL